MCGVYPSVPCQIFLLGEVAKVAAVGMAGPGFEVEGKFGLQKGTGKEAHAFTLLSSHSAEAPVKVVCHRDRFCSLAITTCSSAFLMSASDVMAENHCGLYERVITGMHLAGFRATVA